MGYSGIHSYGLQKYKSESKAVYPEKKKKIFFLPKQNKYHQKKMMRDYE